MARIQLHHVMYQPEWTLELNMLAHRTVSRVQNTKATPQAFADLTNLMHAVAYEWNRMRMELDVGGDLRVQSSGEGKLIKELRKEIRLLKKKNQELNGKLRESKRRRTLTIF